MEELPIQPQNQVERVVYQETFTASLILFWLKAEYKLTSKRVTGHQPNTLFGVIPLGKREIAQPLKTIASVVSSTKFHIKRLLLGFFLIAIGSSLTDEVLLLGVLLIAVGLINIFNCYTATFVITNNGGQKEGYELSILDKERVQRFVREVNDVIADL